MTQKQLRLRQSKQSFPFQITLHQQLSSPDTAAVAPQLTHTPVKQNLIGVNLMKLLDSLMDIVGESLSQNPWSHLPLN